jgi:hypothetical protein
MATGVFTPYSTISAFTAVFTSWIPEIDKERIAAYQSYEEIYWNHPETFKLVVRGTENKPIYLPSGRIIVDTVNRFVAKKLGFAIQPAPGLQPGAEQEFASGIFTDWFARETMRSKFNSNKLYGIMRGDWLFHVVANPNKLPGTRVSIKAIDPGSYFPVYHDDDLDRLIKIHLAESYLDNEGKEWIRKETYERSDPEIAGSQIIHTVAIYEPDKAFKSDGRPAHFLVHPTLLPLEITSFPVYLIKNFDQPGNPFGSSEMRGLEVIMAALNQAVSDEDLSLALDGLGVYWTSSPGPVDEEGNDTDYVIGPGRVINNISDFNRVQGVGSVTPYSDHMNWLWTMMKMAGGTPDSAIGKIDVQVAESGVARLMELAPILAKAEEKTDLAADTMEHLFFDLRTWFRIYEQWNLENTRILPTFGDPLPQNVKAEVDLCDQMVAGRIMSAETARLRLAKMGFEFAPNEQELIAAEQKAGAAAADPFGERLGEEESEEEEGSDE